MERTQLMLAIGIGVVVITMAILNLKAFVVGSINLVRAPERRPVVNKARMKPYLALVSGLTLVCFSYNVLITRNLATLLQITGVECLVLTAGLQSVVLYTKNSQD